MNYELKNKGIDTGWKNPPSLSDLKSNFSDAKPYHDLNVAKIDTYLDNLNIKGSAKRKKEKGRSNVQPKLIRKHAEWRYAALSEPFLGMEDLYSAEPRTHADKLAAEQNKALLNYQWDNEINKTLFVDSAIRTYVDQGTLFCRLSWESESYEEEYEEPSFEFLPTAEQSAIEQLQQAAMLKQRDPYVFEADIPDEIKQALLLTEQYGQPIYPIANGSVVSTRVVYTKNQPNVEVCDYRNCYPDPSCKGDLDKAEFFIYSFESSRSALRKAGIYKNLESIAVSSAGVLESPDHSINEAFTFKDEPRQKFVVYEYWGNWDIHGTGETVPIICSWVNDVVIRLEENPYPDKKIPFEAASYLPTVNDLYGEPDGALLEENQAIVGAVTRGAIDLLARSANAQRGLRQDALDSVNKRKYNNGEDYEFNPNIVDARAALIQHTYPEIPNSVPTIIQWQNNEAESLTGVKPFSGGLSGNSLGETATAVRGVLDAATKRETGILRRLSNLMVRIGKRFASMNAAFLDDEKIIRITDDKFIAIRREALQGNYDLKVNISTAEEDTAKAQELAFMLQTMGNTLPFELSQLVLAENARLRKMPALAKRIEDYSPQPDPMQQQIAQLEVQLKQLQIAELEAKVGKVYADTGLSNAKAQESMVKAGNIQSDTDQRNLDFLEQQNGVKHQRNVEQDKAQSEGNMALKILEAQLQQLYPKPKSQ